MNLNQLDLLFSKVNCVNYNDFVKISYIAMTVFQLQKVGAPPAAGAFVKKDAPPTAFRKFYERGDFPIALEHDTKGNKIAWKVCIICYHVMKRNSKLTYFLITLLLIILCCMFLG